MCIQIILSQDQAVLIDAQDYLKVSGLKWFAARTRSGFYAATNIRKPDGKTTILMMHRLIMDAPKGREVDHKNGDTLDNRRNNLRLCSHADNMHNCKMPQRNKTSRYKGVSYSIYDSRLRRKKWSAYISVNKKTVHLGWFDNETAAAQAYNSAAIRFFGEFARLNDIERGDSYSPI